MAKQDLFGSALAAEGVTGPLAQVARSIYQQESSSGKNTKTSNAGAVGHMQIIPSTFASVADKSWDIANPEHNLRAGIRYLKQLDKLSGGVPELTAAGYYGGPGGMAKAKQGIAVHDPRNPNAPSTLEYGRQVVARMGGQAKPTAPSQVAAAPVESLPVQAVEPTAVAAAETAPEATAVPAGPDQWQEFLQNYQSRSVQSPADLSAIGSEAAMPTTAAVPMVQSMAGYAPQPSIQPNFQRFTALRGRA